MTGFRENVAATIVGGLAVLLLAFIAAKSWKAFWGWLANPAPRRETPDTPVWVVRLRWWINSTHEQKLTPSQWFNWYVSCPLEGHHFPRNLPNNEGRWKLRAMDQAGKTEELWFGRCDKCSALIEAHGEEELNELEQKGIKVWRPRRRTRGKPAL